jgi:pimeloyl-ACP methyl ester carboxylesterase
MNILLPVAAIVVVALVAMVGAFVWARSNPLRAFEKMTRGQLKRAGMTRQRITVASQPLVYWSGGTGEKTVVVVHGVNDQAGTWSGVARVLRDQYRVVAIDLPGHGESGPKNGALPMRHMIDALATVIDRVSPDAPVVVVGNSMGGWVSMLYAAEHRHRVAKLILEDASGMAWDLSHVPAFPKDRAESLKLLRMVHGPTAPLPEHVLDAMVRIGPTLPQARVLEQEDIAQWLVDARLSRLTMPVTLLWGRNDGLLPEEYAEALAARVEGARLHWIDNAAHVPHRQSPAEFIRLLREAIEA